MCSVFNVYDYISCMRLLSDLRAVTTCLASLEGAWPSPGTSPACRPLTLPQGYERKCLISSCHHRFLPLTLSRLACPAHSAAHFLLQILSMRLSHVLQLSPWEETLRKILAHKGPASPGCKIDVVGCARSHANTHNRVKMTGNPHLVPLIE